MAVSKTASEPASGLAPGLESGQVDAADVKAFQEKFKSWRQR
jgi:hypothetical protein